MEQSPSTKQQKNLSSSKNGESQKNAVVYFPKSKKPSLSSVKKGLTKGLGVLKRSKPILFAVLISTIFASVAFSVIDPEVPAQPALVEQPEPSGDEVVETVGSTKTTIPAFTMWIVQAGVFKEIASAETSYRALAEKMPTIQTSHEGLFALWIGSAPNEMAAKEIATKNGTEETPLYVKQVTRPPVEMDLGEEDATWIQGLNDFIQAQWTSSEPLDVPENLIATQPQNDLLQPAFKALEGLQTAGVQPGVARETAFLQVVESIWELT